MEKKDGVHDYSKIKRDIKRGFYDYDKMFFDLIVSLNRCETQKEIIYFKNTFTKSFVNDEDTPGELVQYLNDSINNKIACMTRREEIDLNKLRKISNNTHYL